jgi:cysteinyl-tRNA synthetase
VATLDRLYGTLRDLGDDRAGVAGGVPLPASIDSALHDDLNTPNALAALSQLASDARKAEGAARAAALDALRAGGAMLGLLGRSPSQWFARGATIDEARVQALVDRRQAAKKEKRFDEADAIRRELTDMGIQLEDTPQGPRWSVARPSSAPPT